jgi:hypothetical protein
MANYKNLFRKASLTLLDGLLLVLCAASLAYLSVPSLGARLKIDVLRTDSSREAPIQGYPVQCASANDGTAPMVGILGSILFPLPTFF